MYEVRVLQGREVQRRSSFQSWKDWKRATNKLSPLALLDSQLCPEVIFAATPPFTLGTLCRYYKLPHELVYTLPDTMSLEDGAMIEPLAVGIHSVAKLGRFQTGQNIIVFGAGPVGLLCMAVAKALGAKRVIAVGKIEVSMERSDERREG